MSPELLRAHRELDVAVDRALGLKGHVTDHSRLKALFSNYAKLIALNELALPPLRPRKSAQKARGATRAS